MSRIFKLLCPEEHLIFLPVRPGGDVDDDGGVLHGDDEEDVLVARVELHPQHRRREPEPLQIEGRFNRL